MVEDQFNKATSDAVREVCAFGSESPNSTKIVMLHSPVKNRPNMRGVAWQGIDEAGNWTKSKSLAEVQDKTGISIAGLAGDLNVSHEVLENNDTVIVDSSLIPRLREITSYWSCQNHFEHMKNQKVASLNNAMNAPLPEAKYDALEN